MTIHKHYPDAAAMIDRTWPRASEDALPWREDWADTETQDGARLDDLNYQLQSCGACTGLPGCTHHDVHKESYRGDSTYDVGCVQVWRPVRITNMSDGENLDEEYWDITTAVNKDGEEIKTGHRFVLTSISVHCRYRKGVRSLARQTPTAAHVPRIHWASGLDNFELVDGSAEVVAVAMRYIDERLWTKGKWLLLYGPVGGGKTHIATAIQNAAIAAGYVTDFHTAAQLLGQGVNSDKSYGEAERRSSGSSDLAIIDELGREYVGKTEDSYQRTAMRELFNNIYENKGGLIITANGTSPKTSSKFSTISRC